MNAGLQLWKGEVKQLTESDTDHMVQRWVIAVIWLLTRWVSCVGYHWSPTQTNPSDATKSRGELVNLSKQTQTLKTSVSKDVEKRETSCTAGNVSWGSRLATSTEGPQTIRSRTTI